MTNKELQKLGRRELLQRLIEQAEEAERLGKLLRESGERLKQMEEDCDLSLLSRWDRGIPPAPAAHRPPIWAKAAPAVSLRPFANSPVAVGARPSPQSPVAGSTVPLCPIPFPTRSRLSARSLFCTRSRKQTPFLIRSLTRKMPPRNLAPWPQKFYTRTLSPGLSSGGRRAGAAERPFGFWLAASLGNGGPHKKGEAESRGKWFSRAAGTVYR